MTSIEKNRDSKGSEGNSYLVNIKINKALMYDYPLFYQRLSNYLDLKKYIDDDSSPKKISQLKQSEENLLNTDYWQGLYTYLPSKNFTAILTTPKFEKIREGQVYRLVTPAFLHADVFHLFFNMLWLLVLGKQIEEKIKPFKYILLIIALATFSNTVQYLITGPNFLGFSGVLCGMLTFVWMRAKVAPWEGYDIDKWTFLSLMGFIVAMSILQLVSLLLNLYFQINLPLSIANSAHLSGAFGGYLLAKHKFFRWSHSL